MSVNIIFKCNVHLWHLQTKLGRFNPEKVKFQNFWVFCCWCDAAILSFICSALQSKHLASLFNDIHPSIRPCRLCRSCYILYGHSAKCWTIKTVCTRKFVCCVNTLAIGQVIHRANFSAFSLRQFGWTITLRQKFPLFETKNYCKYKINVE